MWKKLIISCLILAATTIASAEKIAYVDATHGASGNTSLAGGGTFDLDPNFGTGLTTDVNGSDNLWRLRPFGNPYGAGTVYESGGQYSMYGTNNTEDCPRLKTTVTNLPYDTYKVYVYFWSDTSSWRIRASLTDMPGELPLYYSNSWEEELPPIGDPPAEFLYSWVQPPYLPDPTVLFNEPVPIVTEGSRLLWQAYLGTVTGTSTSVYIDDDANHGSHSKRTWYDGIGYELLLPGPANKPNPANGATGVLGDVVLSWRSGADANKHDLYFDTDFDDVNDANRASHAGLLIYEPNHNTNSYDPYGAEGFLDLGTTYYWRIDEVNDANIWRGDLWQFTTSHLVIDDFDSYANSEALRTVWKDGEENGTWAVVFLETDTARDGNSMKYLYVNELSPYYSEADANMADLKMDSDWLSIDAEALLLYFYGEADNPVSEQMYVTVTDGANETATVLFDDDPNALKQPVWHRWNIALQEFSSSNPDIDLSDVKKLTIGFGDGSEGSSGVVYFEDIQLRTSRCALMARSEDFARADYAPPGTPYSGDCVINLRELEMMANHWLMTSPPAEPDVDVYDDGTIDFKDFALVAEMWLEEEFECFPDYHPDYPSWVTADRPDCWCCPTQCHGDANCDGVVDDLDLNAIYPLIGATYPDPDYDSCFDFDHNLVIGTVDLDLLEYYYYNYPNPPGDCLASP